MRENNKCLSLLFNNNDIIINTGRVEKVSFALAKKTDRFCFRFCDIFNLVQRFVCNANGIEIDCQPTDNISRNSVEKHRLPHRMRSSQEEANNAMTICNPKGKPTHSIISVVTKTHTALKQTLNFVYLGICSIFFSFQFKNSVLFITTPNGSAAQKLGTLTVFVFDCHQIIEVNVLLPDACCNPCSLFHFRFHASHSPIRRSFNVA